MEQRERAECDVARHDAQTGMLEHLPDVGAEVAVGEHRRPRRPGRPRGEEQDGEVVAGPLDDGSRRVGERVEVEDERGDDDPVEARGDARRRDDERRVDHPELPPELGRRSHRVQRYGDAPDGEHGEVPDDRLLDVRSDRARPDRTAPRPDRRADGRRVRPRRSARRGWSCPGNHGAPVRPDRRGPERGAARRGSRGPPWRDHGADRTGLDEISRTVVVVLRFPTQGVRPERR